MVNIAVAQSGGPTSAINASLAGILIEARKHAGIKNIFGFKNGIDGVLNEIIVNLGEIVDTEEKLELLKLTPSTALGSCRMKLPDSEENEDVCSKILGVFEKYEIDAFFYVGGNDSMDTVSKLSKYFKKIGKKIKVIGIPKTIDNDLCLTDHTPGFGSAAKYVATTVQEIIRDSEVYALDSVTIIEIMGRDAGWLTASTGVLKYNGETAPHLIYLPEMPFNILEFVNDVKTQQEDHKAVVIAVSEGLRFDNGDYVAEGIMSGAVDVFGHKYLAGLGKFLENVVKDKIGCKVRSIELNVMQRCASHIASMTDVEEALSIGAAGLAAAISGETGKMMSFNRLSNNPYKVAIETVDIDEVANKEKSFPHDWINAQGNGITDEAIEYFLPLIQGEVITPMKNGMPVHFKI